jgi:hypothetical protein
MNARRLLAVASLLLLSSCSCDGEGVDRLRGALSPSDERLVFDDTLLGSTSTRTLSLTNSGGAPLTVELAVDAMGETFVVREPMSPLTLAAGATVQMVLRFRPPSTGVHEGALQLRSSEGDVEGATVALIGLGANVPSCDDNNPCTDDVFEPASETCVHLAHTRACEPDNRCLIDAVCVEGACVGTTVTCPASVSPCRDAVCDPTQGCIEIDIAGACVDDDPCTTDRCTDDGCAFDPAPDYQPCGELVTCVSAPVCLSGACVDVPIPDGAPCDDGLLCTDAICAGGACVGTPVEGEPEVLFSDFGLGTRESSVTRIEGDRILIFDPELRTGDEMGVGTLTALARDETWQVVHETRVASILFTAVMPGTSLSPWFLVGHPNSYFAAVELLPPDSFRIADFPITFRDGVVLENEVLTCSSGADVLRRFTLSPSTLPVEQPPLQLPGVCAAIELVATDTDPVLVVWTVADQTAQLTFYAAPTFDDVEELFTHIVTPGGFLSSGDGYALFSQFGAPNSSSTLGSVLLFDLNPGGSTEPLSWVGPLGSPNPGRATTHDGQIWMRWGQQPANGRSTVYRRPVTAGFGWEEISGSPFRRYSAPAPVVVDDLVVLPAFQDAGTVLMVHDGDASLSLHPLGQQRGGQLVQDGARLLSVASDRITSIAPLTDAPSWQMVAPMPVLPQMQLLRVVDALHLVDPGALADPFSPAVLRMPPGGLFGVRLNAADELTLTAHSHPIAPEPLALASLRRSAVVHGDLLLVVTAVDGANDTTGPLMLSIYDMNDPLAGATWAPLGELELMNANYNTSQPMALAAQGDRAAVLAPESLLIGETSLILVDISDPTLPFVLGQWTDHDGGDHHLAVGGDLLIRQSSDGVGVVYDASVSPVPLGNTLGLPDGPKPLAFDGEVLLVAGDTGLHYFERQNGNLLNFMPTHEVELGERPIDIEEVDGRLYVTTERGLHVISPPCPGP